MPTNISPADTVGVKWSKLQLWVKQACENAGITAGGDDPLLKDIQPSDSEGVKWAKLQRWVALLAENVGGGGAVSSVNGKTGVVVLNKADIGLGNVDNTSDANKPLSNAELVELGAVRSLTGRPQSLSFFGTSNVGQRLANALGNSQFTIGMRISVPTANPAASIGIFSIGTYTAVGNLCAYITNAGVLRLEVFGAGAYSNFRVANVSGFVSAFGGRYVWIHIVRSSTGLAVYVNGVAQSVTGSVTGTVDPWETVSITSTAITVGALGAFNYYTQPLGPWDIYNRALSAVEVQNVVLDGAPASVDIHPMAAGAPIITGDDSTFAADTGRWSRQTGVTISGGFLNFSNVPQYQGALWLNANSLRPGYRYRTTVVVSTLTSGRLYVVGTEVGAVGDKVLAAAGTYTFDFVTRAAEPYYKISAFDPNTSATIDSVTLVPVGAVESLDREQPGEGLLWQDVSGNTAHASLPASGVSWVNPTRLLTEQAVLNARMSPSAAVTFDGSTSGTITNIPTFGTADFTVAARVRRVQSAAANLVIMGAASAGCFLLFSDNANSYRIVAAKAGGPALVTSNASLTDGWNHVAYVRQGGIGTIYINGAASGSSTDTSDYTTASSGFGAYTSTRWRGDIGPLDVFNRALSATEVLSLAVEGVPAYNDMLPRIGGAGTKQFPTDLTGGAVGIIDTTSGNVVFNGGFANVRFPASVPVGTRVSVTLNITAITGNVQCNQSGVFANYQTFNTTGVRTFTYTTTAEATGFYFSAAGAISMTWSALSVTVLGAIVSLDRDQPGEGLVWQDASGNSANVVLPTSGISWKNPTRQLTEQNVVGAGRYSMSQALVFDGSAGAALNIPAFGTGDFTATFTVKPYRLVNYQRFCGGNTNSFSAFADSLGRIWIYRESTLVMTSPTQCVQTNVSTVITYTRSGSVGTIYANGVAVHSAADSSNYSAPVLFVGASGGAGQFDRLVGEIANVGFLNRALSAAEVLNMAVAGFIPATDIPTQPTGSGLVLGDNSTFASDTGFWTRSGATIAGGVCTLAAAGNFISRGGLLVPGKRYRASVNITAITGSVFFGNLSGTELTTHSTTGVKNIEFVCSTAGNFGVQVVPGGTSCTIDDVTLTPIGAICALDREQHGYGYVWHDISPNQSNIQIPTAGVSWLLPHYPAAEVWAIQALPTDVVFGSKSRDAASAGTGASATALQSSPPAGLGPTSYSLSVGSSGTGASLSGWRGGLGGSVNRFPYTQAQVPTAEWFTAFAIPTFSDGTDTFTVRIGFGVQGTSAATLPTGFAGVLIEGANVTMCSRNSNVDTLGAVTTITANTTVRFRMRYDSGIFAVWINGLLLGQMAAPASFHPFPLIQILATAGTNSRNVLHGTGAFQFAINASAL